MSNAASAGQRLACVALPALPLQLLWRERPTWREHPVVIVDEDRPQGEVLWACERARANRILPGMRYGHALSLVSDLYATTMPPEQIAAAITELAAVLRVLSPSVEPGDPGTFWLDGSGLERLFPEAPPPQPSPRAAGGGGSDATIGTAWGRAIADALRRQQLAGAVVVGFSRFATLALSKAARQGLTVFACDGDERAAARMVPLARLELDPKLRDQLARLGVTTIGQLVQLPGGGVLERFGSDAHRLYQLAAGERWDPLVPEPPPEAPDEVVLLDDPESDVERLLFSIKAALDRLLQRLAARQRAATSLTVELTLHQGAVGTRVVAERVAHVIVPAAATLDGRTLLRLVHLRLDSQPPQSGVIKVRVWGDEVAATREQLQLFAERPRRDLGAGNEALARVRAELGDDAVVKATLCDGHLPEAQFRWERLPALAAARPRGRPSVRPLARRLLLRPTPLPPQSPHVRDDGWLLAGLEHGAVVRIDGPYVVSGGWWASEVHREYHFAETRRGEVLWVYYDRARRRWFWHGSVE